MKGAPGLKDCPFCGGGAEPTSRFDVKCTACGAEINSQTPETDWNRRSPDAYALVEKVLRNREVLELAGLRNFLEDEERKETGSFNGAIKRYESELQQLIDSL